jgi:hypothetical protein
MQGIFHIDGLLEKNRNKLLSRGKCYFLANHELPLPHLFGTHMLV